MTDAQRAASAEAVVMAAAIIRLGGTATAAAISEQSALPLTLIRRRLVRNGPSMMRVASRYFIRAGESWGLTESGRALVAASGP